MPYKILGEFISGQGVKRSYSLPRAAEALAEEQATSRLYNEEWKQINRNICDNFDINWY